MKHFKFATWLLASVLATMVIVFPKPVTGAEKKISEFNLLPAASFSTGDLIPIVDISADETKKTRILDFDTRYITNPFTSDGDTLYFLSGSPAKLSIGSTGTVYTANTGTPSWAKLADLNIATGAAISLAKLAPMTVSKAVVSDGSGFLTPSATTASEIGFVSGVTSSLCGITQSCTVTNKTLTSPVINAPNLTGGTASNSIRLVLPQDTTVNLASLTNVAGLLAYDTTLSKVVYNNGAAMVAVGSGSGGGLVGDRELNPNPTLDDPSGAAYAAYADAAGVMPVDATGGSPNTTCARTTSSPITGAGSLLITKSGSANRQGEGCSIATLPLSKADTLPTVEQIDFDYTIPSGTFTAGTDGPSAIDSDYEVYLYDVANSVVIQPLVYKLYSTTQGHYTGWFQTATNATTYRLALHNATTTTNNFTLKPDNISIHPAKSIGAPIGVVASRAHIGTPASTSAGNPLNFDSIDYDYTNSITTGATTWTYTAKYPGLYRISTSAFSVASSGVQIFKNGSALFDVTSIEGNANLGGGGSETILKAGDTIDIRVSSTMTPVDPGNGVGLGTYVSIFMINGGSGSSIPNPVIAASYFCSTAQTSTTSTPFNFDSVEYDYSNAVTTGSGWNFKAPVPGLYSVKFFFQQTGASNANLVIYKNGSAYKSIGTTLSNLVAGNVGGDVQLNAGDTIDIRATLSTQVAGGALNGGSTANINIFLVPPGGGSSPAGTVSSNSYGLERIERAVVIDNGATCSVTSQSGAWLGSCTRSAGGNYTVAIVAGMFSSAPVCIPNASSTNFNCVAKGTSTSNLFVECLDTGGSDSQSNFNVLCMGPR